MAMILLYYVLLAVWPLLLWPSFRLKGWSRGWLIVTAVAGALATAHEVPMFLGPPAAIRLDAYLIAMVLGSLSPAAAAGRGWAPAVISATPNAGPPDLAWALSPSMTRMSPWTVTPYPQASATR